MIYNMVFNEEKVRVHLEKHGFVYTIRQKNKRPLPEKRHAVIGNYRNGTQKPLGYDVRLTELENEITEIMYLKHLIYSGFDTVQEWKDAVKRQHPKPERPLVLIRAERVKP